MKGFGLYLLILVCLLAGVSYVVSQTQKTESISYSDVYSYFEQGDVDRYTLEGGTLTMHLKNENRAVSYEIGDYTSVWWAQLGSVIDQQMKDGTLTKVDYITTTIPWWAQFLPYLILVVLIGAFWYFMMNKQSGLLAISGISNDARDIRTRASEGDERCLLAFDMFAYKAMQQAGSMIASMAGVDTITFTAGIGENDWSIRKAFCDCFEWLGVRIDNNKNREAVGNGPQVISAAGSAVTVMVIPTDEEYMIAHDVERLTKNN